jgi:hypothetical protein
MLAEIHQGGALVAKLEVHEYDLKTWVPILTRMRSEARSWTFVHPNDVLPKFAVRLLRGRNCPELCR